MDVTDATSLVTLREAFVKRVLLIAGLVSLFAIPSLAQNLESNRGGSSAEAKGPSGIGIDTFAITADYNSWFEKLEAISNTGVAQTSEAQFYGLGLGVEKTRYYPTWGWSFGGSLLKGSAVGGDKNGDLAYFETQVPWLALRASPRLFYRVTPRTSVGLALAATYKQDQWPKGAAGNVRVVSGVELITGAFVDVRIRMGSNLEMYQSFGSVYKDTSIYWRLGIGYRL